MKQIVMAFILAAACSGAVLAADSSSAVGHPAENSNVEAASLADTGDTVAVVDTVVIRKLGRGICQSFNAGFAQADKSSATSDDLAMFDPALSACARMADSKPNG